jgi:DEAD/DEAH box helicase domain-containing protein
MRHSLILDLETRRLANDLGEGGEGWRALRQGLGGASAIVIWSTSSGRPHLYDDNSVYDAVALLESCDLLLSFNGVGFDIPVLEGLSHNSINIKYHLDLLQIVWEALGCKGKGYTLDDIAQRTLGHGKTGDGKDAPALAEEGRFGELFQYCLDDVCLTRDLFRFVQEHGGIIDVDGDLLPLYLPDWFSEVQI